MKKRTLIPAACAAVVAALTIACGSSKPPAAPTPPPAQPAEDRWGRFAEELKRCQGESFMSRVICDQRVRLRYCDGYWNKVPQCPGGVTNPDR